MCDREVEKCHYQLDTCEFAAIYNQKNLLLLMFGSQLNHGLTFDASGKRIFASTSATAYSWTYNLKAGTASLRNTTVVTGMYNTDHK